MSAFLQMEGGNRMTIDDDLFDVLWNSLDNDEQHKEAKRKAMNDKHNAKNKENGYYKEYFKKNDTPFECERCGCKLKSKSNKSAHLKTPNCQRLYEQRKYNEMEDQLIKKIVCL